jgi:hypothetical protein
MNNGCANEAKCLCAKCSEGMKGKECENGRMQIKKKLYIYNNTLYCR